MGVSPGSAAAPRDPQLCPRLAAPGVPSLVPGYLDIAADAADAGVGLQDAEHLGGAGGVQHRV